MDNSHKGLSSLSIMVYLWTFILLVGMFYIFSNYFKINSRLQSELQGRSLTIKIAGLNSSMPAGVRVYGPGAKRWDID